MMEAMGRFMGRLVWCDKGDIWGCGDVGRLWDDEEEFPWVHGGYGGTWGPKGT